MFSRQIFENVNSGSNPTCKLLAANRDRHLGTSRLKLQTFSPTCILALISLCGLSELPSPNSHFKATFGSIAKDNVLWRFSGRCSTESWYNHYWRTIQRSQRTRNTHFNSILNTRRRLYPPNDILIEMHKLLVARSRVALVGPAGTGLILTLALLTII